MKRNGFTLIELLVVVAIIGILAAVGTVAYNGYTSAAKSSAAKANFRLVFNYMATETKKCSLGFDTAMDGALNCATYNSGSAVIKSTLVYNAIFYTMNGWDGSGTLPKKSRLMSNPFGKASAAGVTDNGFWGGSANSRDEALGFVRYAGNSEIWLRICFKSPCSNLNNQLLEKYRLE
jgi:prepilin-type N-terminal cleavage/methylation domain-containing protein